MIAIAKGTKDVLPEESYKWQYTESLLRKIATERNFKEIRTPMFEHTELFARGVGESSDIVNKEMYTFIDKGGRSITLRPEGTAGVARSFLENSLYALPQPIKMFYLASAFRYEKPQAGRLREHHQFGAELFGADGIYADAEVILLALDVFRKFQIENIELHLNSIGCAKCRKEYNAALVRYFTEKKDKLCKTCLERLEKNPLRLLDCKDDGCREINSNAPVVLEYLCDECKEYHQKLTEHLTSIGVHFTVDPKVVRGLDYYTRTVFEFMVKGIGAKETVCGGGRYNTLTADIGGKEIPAVGFGIGLERLMKAAESQGINLGKSTTPDYYIAPICEQAYSVAVKIAESYRNQGFCCEYDLTGRSVKAQMKYADKIGAKQVLVIGEEELQSGFAVMKNMENKSETKVDLSLWRD